MTEAPDFSPHILATIPLVAGQRAFVDVALRRDAGAAAYEVAERCPDGSYAPVLVIDALRSDQLRSQGHCTPEMVWGTLHPTARREALRVFVAPRDGLYAVTQERDRGVATPKIHARMSTSNGLAEKLRRHLARCGRAVSRLARQCAARG